MGFDFPARRGEYYRRAVKKGVVLGASIALGIPLIPACVVGVALADIFLEKSLTSESKKDSMHIAIHEVVHQFSASSSSKETTKRQAKVGFLPFINPARK